MTYTEYIDGIPVHPHAAAYPMMSAEELQALADDIKANGQHELITLTTFDPEMLDDWFIIDGRNRYAACKLAGVEPKVRHAMSLDDREISPEVVEAWIDSKNLHRRHLTPEQKRERIKAALSRNPELPDYQIAKRTNTSPHTVKRVREDNPDLQGANERVNARGQKRPATYDRAPGFNRGDLDEINQATPAKAQGVDRAGTHLTNVADQIATTLEMLETINYTNIAPENKEKALHLLEQATRSLTNIKKQIR